MSGEKPFFIEGVVVEVLSTYEIAFVKVINGNVYNLKPSTPGIDFYTLKAGQIVELEVTTRLLRVLSARIIDKDKAGGCPADTLGLISQGRVRFDS